MTRDEHKAITAQLLGMIAPDHQADASALLTQLGEDYETTLTASEASATQVANLTTANEKLREVNTNLFLKVGTPAPKPNDNHNTNTPEKDDGGDKLTFEALFNEKGELI